MPHEIEVCMGSSCFARGNADNLEYIENYIKENKLDATLYLAGKHCQNECEDGPHIFINGKDFNEVDESKLKEILKNLE